MAGNLLHTPWQILTSLANVFGLSKELDMTDGNKYNIALVIFFVPYILFEIPSNILLKKLKPRVWLSLCMFGFGLGKSSMLERISEHAI
jgi:hypothetical protein